MIEYINKTGLNFTTGHKLTLADLQIMNNTINKLVDAVNMINKGSININSEINDFSKSFTLSEAISTVSTTRRWKGMKIRFKNSENIYKEYSYIGNSVNDSDWNNISNWISEEPTLIDGGEW